MAARADAEAFRESSSELRDRNDVTVLPECSVEGVQILRRTVSVYEQDDLDWIMRVQPNTALSPIPFS
jgi:hypothetical protein